MLLAVDSVDAAAAAAVVAVAVAVAVVVLVLVLVAAAVVAAAAAAAAAPVAADFVVVYHLHPYYNSAWIDPLSSQRLRRHHQPRLHHCCFSFLGFVGALCFVVVVVVVVVICYW